MTRARKTAKRKARKQPFRMVPKSMADYGNARLAMEILNFEWYLVYGYARTTEMAKAEMERMYHSVEEP